MSNRKIHSILISFIFLCEIFSIFLPYTSKFLVNSRSDINFNPILDSDVPTVLDPISDLKIVRPNSIHDIDGDKISNILSELIKAEEKEKINTFISINRKLNNELTDKLEKLDVEIISSYDELIYGIYAEVPINKLSEIANLDEIVLIENEPKSKTHLDTSTINMGVRGSNYVWDATPGIKGNSNYSIAILDTGVDSTHLDIANLIHFRDFTDHHYPNGTTGYDYGHHGTHCASIAAGTGMADTNPETVNLTFSGYFPDTENYYYPHFFEVKDNDNDPDTLLNMTWDDSCGGTVRLAVVDSEDYFLIAPTESTSSPVIHNVGKLDSGWYRAYCSPRDSTATLKNYTVQVSSEYNYTLNEPVGTPLFSGVAPKSNIVSLKVLNDTGSGEGTWFLKALDWISNHGKDPEYNITVVSMSLGFNGIYAILDTAINNLVSEGFICVTSAGNDGTNNGNNAIGSPGSAAKAITVGAVNDALEVSYYSSNGASDLIYRKPDVLAPGGSVASSGSNATNNLIIAADSNYAEDDIRMADVYNNSYIGMQGTSMAAPHVSGLAQLVIDAITSVEGGYWTWSEENALKVKQLICMGTWEVNAGENYDGDGDAIPQNPPINRNSSDFVEGYGMVRADAVIQAITNLTTGPFYNKQFYLDRRNSTHAKDPKVLLFGFQAEAGKIYNFTLNVSMTADFDLIIYSKDYNTTDGRPIVLASSTNETLGANETISFTPSADGTYYWSVRAVQGYGQCKVSLNPGDDTTPPNWNNLIESSDPLEFGASESISIDVSDDGIVHKVWISLGSTNYSMTKISSTTYRYIWIPSILGVNNYTIFMNDTNGNINFVKGAITVRDTTAPVWDQVPTDKIIEYNTSFTYDLNASDLAGIHHWWLGDETNNFSIDSKGIIKNATLLSKENYSIDVRAYDPSNNYCSASIIIKINNIPDSDEEELLQEEIPDLISGYDLILIVGCCCITSLFFIRKKIHK